MWGYIFDEKMEKLAFDLKHDKIANENHPFVYLLEKIKEG